MIKFFKRLFEPDTRPKVYCCECRFYRGQTRWGTHLCGTECFQTITTPETPMSPSRTKKIYVGVDADRRNWNHHCQLFKPRKDEIQRQ